VAHNAQPWEGLLLHTDRLRLRTPTPRDADALYDLFKDPDVMHGLGKEPVLAREQARAIVEEWITAWRTDALGPFIFETATNRRVVGQAGLMIFDTRGWTPSTWGTAGSHAHPSLAGPCYGRIGATDTRPKESRQSGNGHTSFDPSNSSSL
jgi:RimJ/RimL family protein N-acetyltransferase